MPAAVDQGGVTVESFAAGIGKGLEVEVDLVYFVSRPLGPQCAGELSDGRPHPGDPSAYLVVIELQSNLADLLGLSEGLATTGGRLLGGHGHEQRILALH